MRRGGDKAGEYIGHVKNSMNRLEQLADILLKLAELDSDALIMKRDPINILDLVEDIKLELEAYFIKDKVSIKVYGDGFTLFCDRRWTYEAIFNIVKNGIKASKTRGVEIQLKNTGLYKSVVVKDFGKGLDRDRLKKAFRQFYKENPDSKGYGIGLPMAKSIMEKQNGDLLYLRGKTSNLFELRFYN